MEPADSIVRLGFQRWHERQLIESHAYLVSFFLCVIAILVCIENFSIRAPGAQQLILLGVMYAIGALGYYSWVRYVALFACASHFAENATCEKCKSYAAFAVTRTGSRARNVQDRDLPDTGTWLAAKCKICGHEWTVG